MGTRPLADLDGGIVVCEYLPIILSTTSNVATKPEHGKARPAKGDKHT
jgi:hypothetical protein